MKVSIGALACLLTAAALAAAGCSKGTIGSPVSTKSDIPIDQQWALLQKQGLLPTLDVSSSVPGTDANGNGVRDDLDKFIASLPDSAAQKNALTQLAQAVQAAMTVDTTNATAVATVSLNLNRADTCIWAVYPSGQSAKAMTIEELSVNTLNRLKAYEQYNAARDGAVDPALTGNTCN